MNDAPVVISVKNPSTKIVASDGFHFTKPLELKYKEPSYYSFVVTCAIEDLQLLGGGFILVLLYLAGFLTGLWILKVLSFAPIIWLLAIYYLNRKQFLKFVPSRE